MITASRTLIAGGAAAAVAAGLVLAGGTASATSAALTSGPELLISGGTLTNAGSASLTLGVATRNGGAVTSGSGREGGQALRFPAFDSGKNGPRAVVTAVSTGSTDDLNPGTRDFSFGATVRLDNSPTTDPGSSDAGDNVIQRGLYTDPTQYKIEADGGRVVCRIEGKAGAVELKVTPPRIERGTWYGLTCSRAGNVVTVTVTTWSANGTPTTVVRQATGATGDLTPTSRSIPVAIGGKLNDKGNVSATSSDQFNGLIDDAFIDISSTPATAATLLTATPSKMHPQPGKKVKFTGTFLPRTAHSVGQRLTLSFKGKGKGWVTKGSTTVKAGYTYKFKKVKVKKPGKYRVSFAGSSGLAPSSVVLTYKKGRF